MRFIAFLFNFRRKQTLDASTLGSFFVKPLIFAPYIVDMQAMGSFDASHQELQNGTIRFST